jgi:hypothetical protein
VLPATLALLLPFITSAQELDEPYWEILSIPTILHPVNVNIVSDRKYIIRNWYDGLVLTLGNKRVNTGATDEVYVFHQFQKKIDPNSPAGQIVCSVSRLSSLIKFDTQMQWTLNTKSNQKFDILNTTAMKYLSVPGGRESAHTEVLGSTDTSDSVWEIRSAGGNAWT